MTGKPSKRQRRQARTREALKGDRSARVALVKARVISGASVDEVAAIQSITDAERFYNEHDAIIPPYDPVGLMSAYEFSNALRQNIDAYVQNIEGFGHHFKARIDLDADGALERVREAMIVEQYHDQLAEQDAAADEARARGEEPPDEDEDQPDNETQIAVPTDEEVKKRIEELRGEIRLQKMVAQAWFENAGADGVSFSELRKRKRAEQEIIGHGCWEAVRDNRGRLRRFAHVPAFTVYPVKDDGERVESEEVERISPIATRTFTVQRFFRKYVQRVSDKAVFFKGLGDPRIVSRKTGKTYESTNDLEKAEGKKAQLAHEMKYFDVFSPRTPAGVPRWIGNLLAVLGSRAADEVNYLLFDHKSVPPGIFFVRGGKLGDQTKNQLQEFIEDDLQGRDAFHKILICEVPAITGRPGDTPVIPDIQWQSLMADQIKDSTFSAYDQDNRNKLGGSFRNHPMVRGETVESMNRAIAWAVLDFSDQQVYAPERRPFDWFINREVMPEIGCTLIEFMSNGPSTTNLEQVSKATDIFAKHGAFVPNEVRAIASEALDRDLDPIDAEWASQQPMTMTLVGIVPNANPNDEDELPEEMKAKYAALEAKLRDYGFKLAGYKSVGLDDVKPGSPAEDVGDVVIDEEAADS